MRVVFNWRFVRAIRILQAPGDTEWNRAMSCTTRIHTVLRCKRSVRVDHRIVNVAPVPVIRRPAEGWENLIPERELRGALCGAGSFDVRWVVMREHDDLLVSGIQALDKVDLVSIRQRTIHKQIALVVVSTVKADNYPLLTLNGEIARVVLQAERRRF